MSGFGNNDNCNPIAEHYSSFRVTERTLLTGHSHQAWPDVAFEGQQQAFKDAANFVDDKWSVSFEKAAKLKLFYANLLGDHAAESSVNNYTLASSTHDLLVRFLSALDWQKGNRLITTDGEFHSMRRQLGRLQEEGVEVVQVPVSPAETLTERMSAEINSDTIAIMMSAVMFKNSRIISNLQLLAEKAGKQQIPFLVDAYHALNVVPFTLKEHSLEQAFIVGGGYKYCQFGEGNCFLRVPKDTDLRPIVTGWYAEFADLEQTSDPNITAYGTAGARFHGSTYDPTSHYRACSVIDFFVAEKFDINFLRQTSQYQIGLLRDAFDDLDCNPSIICREPIDLHQIGGFLALKTHLAADLQQLLSKKDILTDQRDGYLRFGPAIYISNRQLTDAVLALKEALDQLQ